MLHRLFVFAAHDAMNADLSNPEAMSRRTLLVAAAACVVLTVATGAQEPAPGALTADTLKNIELRGIGPTLATGRIADIEIDPKDPNVWYVASAFGGLWKTVNRGVTFTPIFDNDGSFTLCCVVVDPRNSNVVWLGTGENTSQRSAHFGDGVYKSTDAGATWKRTGLESSEHIGRILIDPRNSNVVYVASQGPLFSSGGERGLYRTTDGGVTWTRILHVSEDTGVSDIVFQPNNPDVIYAAAYQRRRAVGQMVGGGPEGGIFKTTNAGRNWSRLTKGLPAGDTGRAGLAVDPRHPQRVYALVDAKRHESGFFRSDDGGVNWTRIGRMTPITGRGFGGRGGSSSPPVACEPLPATPPRSITEPEPNRGPSTSSASTGAGQAPSTGSGQAAAVQDGNQPQPSGRSGPPSDDCYRGGGAQYYHEIFVDPHRPGSGR